MCGTEVLEEMRVSTNRQRSWYFSKRGVRYSEFFFVRRDGTKTVRSDRVFFFPQKKTDAVAGGPPSKKPRCGAVSGGHPRSTGTGDRHRTRSVFWTVTSVTMGDGVVDDWNSESGEDDGDCERCDDDVDLIETPSPVTDSTKSIVHLPERIEDNTTWLFPEGIKTTTVLNKMYVNSKRYLLLKWSNMALSWTYGFGTK